MSVQDVFLRRQGCCMQRLEFVGWDMQWSPNSLLLGVSQPASLCWSLALVRTSACGRGMAGGPDASAMAAGSCQRRMALHHVLLRFPEAGLHPLLPPRVTLCRALDVAVISCKLTALAVLLATTSASLGDPLELLTLRNTVLLLLLRGGVAAGLLWKLRPLAAAVLMR